jgi:4-alpha-glucanotransferase
MKSLFARPCVPAQRTIKSGKKLVVKVWAPRIASNHSVAITGNQEYLGNWNPQKALILHCNTFPEWHIDLDAGEIRYPLEYKFLVVDTDTRKLVCWEPEENRLLNIPPQERGETVCVSGLFFRDGSPPWKCAGTVIPVFSLRSEKSFGVGDFGDLRLFIDWIKKTRQRIVQILPVNDTTSDRTWKDSYPYNAISVFALHPIYISLSWMGELEDAAQTTFFEEKRKELNLAEEVDYEAAVSLKTAYCRLFFEQEGRQWLDSEAFQTFFSENSHWLIPYAAWCYLRDKYKTADFSQWKGNAVFHKERMKNLCSKENLAYPEISFTFFLQFVLHTQLKNVSDYARANGIVLKGDLPVGVNRRSVEVWTEPQYFNMNGQAGAPPDNFSETGQNWAFPTYNWETMEKDGFAWWKKRLAKMSDYFDCFRIDHILGFFRIWEIPVGYTGLCGHFNPALPLSREEIEAYGVAFHEALFLRDPSAKDRFHPRFAASQSPVYSKLSAPDRNAFDRLYWDFFYKRHNDFWKEQAYRKLSPLIASTNMLPCGEDLGMIPEPVPEVMNKLQILSLEIERMPKTPGREFTDLSRLPYLSVCSTSTHDMSPLRSWWKEDREKSRRYYNEVLGQPGEAPPECTPEIARQIIENHLNAPSMLAIIPLQDWLAVDEKTRRENEQAERINVPLHASHYWRYRMHITIETLMNADRLNEQIIEMIERRQRHQL